MKKILKVLGLVLALALCIGIFAVCIFADEADDDSARYAGYEFHEDDLTIPKYKITYPDPNDSEKTVEKISYISGNLGKDVADAPSGAKVTLLCDIYEDGDRNATETDDDNIGMSIASKKLDFDFAGHKILTERKATLFSASNSTLNIYSSKPGAVAITLDDNSTDGGCFLAASSSAKVNVGRYTETVDGEEVTYSHKIRTYSACALSLGGCVVNVYNCDLYRAGTDFTSFIRATGAAKLLLENVRAIGSHRDLQFSIGSAGAATRGAVFTIRNSYMANMSNIGGHFIRYFSPGSEIHFENTAFDQISFTIEKYHTEGANDKPGVISLDEKCSFHKLPTLNSANMHAVFRLPELADRSGASGEEVPEYIYVNRTQEDILFINVTDFKDGSPDNHSYTFTDYQKPDGSPLGSRYTFAYEGYDEYATQIIWMHNAKSFYQWWILGEIPYPYDLKVDSQTDYIKFVTDNPEPVTEYALYYVTPVVDLDFKYNITLTSDFLFNLYVPAVSGTSSASDILSKVNVGGTPAIEIAKAKTVTIDGEKYYKIVTAIPYSRILEKLNVVVDVVVPGKGGGKVTLSTKLDMLELVNGYLDGDGTPEFKESIKGFVYLVRNAYEDIGLPPPEGYINLINTRYPPVKEEE